MLGRWVVVVGRGLLLPRDLVLFEGLGFGGGRGRW